MEPEHVAEFTKRCSASLMVWGSTSYDRVAELVIVDGTIYIDILDHMLLDLVQNMFEDAMIPFIFKHANPPIHTACNVQT